MGFIDFDGIVVRIIDLPWCDPQLEICMNSKYLVYLSFDLLFCKVSAVQCKRLMSYRHHST